MAFVTLEDKTGEMEIVVFSKQYQRFADLLLPEMPLAVSGTISARDDEKPKLILNAAQRLIANDKFLSAAGKSLYLRVSSIDAPETAEVLSILRENGGDIPVIFYEVKNKRYVKASGVGALATEALLNRLSALIGERNVALQ